MDSQVVVITGGAQGIGFGIAGCFAGRGTRVVVADAKAEAAVEAAQKLKDAGAPDALGIGCDITKREDVEAMATQVLEAFGRVDVLVNNAGISPFVHIMEMEPCDLRQGRERESHRRFPLHAGSGAPHDRARGAR
jgi:3-hydroxybutyrate dehydrogenase